MKKTRKSIESKIMRAVLCVLCAICIIFSGCSGGTDDDTTGSDDSTTTSGDNNGGSTGKEEGGSGVETTIFDLHCFTKLKDGTILFSENDYDYDYTDHTAAKAQCKFTEEARDYVEDKFTKLQEKVQAENPAENTFKTVLNDAINLTDRQGNTYDTPRVLADMLDRGIPVFYQETAKYIAQIINNLDGDDQAKFRACYDHLAAKAYENSMIITDEYRGYARLVTIHKDKPEIADKLNELKIDKADTEKTLMNLLKQVAAKQNIEAETLKDSVNLALDIDGLYGLRDSITIRGGVPAQTINYYENWDEAMASLGGRNHRLSPPRARYQYDPSLYGDYDTYPKPMFGDMLDEELRKLQEQTQSYEMGR